MIELAHYSRYCARNGTLSYKTGRGFGYLATYRQASHYHLPLKIEHRRAFRFVNVKIAIPLERHLNDGTSLSDLHTMCTVRSERSSHHDCISMLSGTFFANVLVALGTYNRTNGLQSKCNFSGSEFESCARKCQSPAYPFAIQHQNRLKSHGRRHDNSNENNHKKLKRQIVPVINLTQTVAHCDTSASKSNNALPWPPLRVLNSSPYCP